MQTRLLINGKLVAGEGKVEDVLNPATGKVLARVPEASRAQIDAAVKAADAAFDGWARTAPKDRAYLLLKLADRIEADGAAFAKVESQNCGKPLHGRAQRRDPRDRRRVPFLRRRLPHDDGCRRRRVPRRVHQHDPSRPDRRRRLDRAVELPVDDGRLEAGSGARGRQHRRAEAFRADAAHGAEARRTAGGDLPGRRRQYRLRSRPQRRRAAHEAPEGAHDLADRRRRDGRPDPRAGGGRHQAHAPRTRRQGAGDRVRRRRRRERRGGRAHVRLLQRGPGLHGRVPHLRRRQGVRQARRRSFGARSARSRPGCRRRRASRWVR